MFKQLNNKEKILILGLGGVGYYLAKRLQHEEYAVAAIEPDAERYRYGDESLDIRLIRGEAMDIDCRREADAPALPWKLLIGGVRRDGDWQIALGSTHIAAGASVIGICLSMQLKELRKLFAV